MAVGTSKIHFERCPQNFGDHPRQANPRVCSAADENTMKTFIAILCLLIAVPVAIGETSNRETIGQLSRSANEELAKSTQELSQLRDQIAAEKLPMSKKLNSLKEQRVQLVAKQE